MKSVNINKAGKRVPMHKEMRDIVLNLLIPKFGQLCWYCGVKLGLKEIHVDHIDPLSRGGEDVIYNLALACKSCNRGKWDLTLKEFFEWVKRLRWLDNFPAKDGFGIRCRFYDRGDEPLDKT